MKKLYLTSINLSGISDSVGKPASQIKLAFVPTAGDTYDDKWFIEADRKQLKQMGIDFVEVDLKGQTEESLSNSLRNVDCVYVAGGNTFYLLEKVRESGFDKVITQLLEKGVVYAGGSAGAVLACPIIQHVAFMDHPEKVPNLKSFQGLGLVDLLIASRDSRH